MLLECGNSVESVLKCLNHASTAVTERFYLKESAAEVQSRCNVPWFRRETESEKRKRGMDALPSFLRTDEGAAKASSSRDGERDERKRQRKEKNKALLRDFNDGQASAASGAAGR
jgi:hypothetical protein